MRRHFILFLDRFLFFLAIFFIAFIPLLPKRPLLDIVGTWVDIRLEDFVIAFSYGVLGLVLLFKKDRQKISLLLPMITYWIIGFISLVNSLLFIGPHLPGFFPNVAILFYLRGIQYMGLFFVGFWAFKNSEKPIRWIIGILAITVFAVFVYGVGQKYYGWPAFSTMNEEFAKGIPLRLPPTARIMSTFAGHYDLGAYLVFVIPILGSFIFSLKNRFYQLLLFLTTVCAFILLLFTASRISFGVYLVTVSVMLWWRRKRLLIIPFIVASIIALNFVSGATERFLKTFRYDDVIVDLSTGKPIGSLEKLEGGVAKIEPIARPDEEDLPKGSGYIASPQTVSTSSGTIQQIEVIKKKNLETGSGEVATVSGSFLVQKAFVLDISITTRFQGQWPRAIEAFKRNILLGSGFSTLSLAADGNYHRLLGETGLLGTIAYLGIFIYSFYWFFKVKHRLNGVEAGFVIGVFSGIVGLLFNAILIDVFHASKVAFTLWLFLGFAIAILSKYPLDMSYWTILKRFFLNAYAYIAYVFIFSFLIFGSSISHYFIGDDFTWLRWAAETKLSDIPLFFVDSSGFFYRPIPKIWYFLLFSLFWLLPQAYHIVSITMFALSAVLVGMLLLFFGVRKPLVVFLIIWYVVMAVHHESVFWISNHSHLLGYNALLGSLLCFLFFWSGKKHHTVWYVGGVILLFISMFSYDIMVVAPLIIFLFGFVIYGKSRSSVSLLVLIPLYVLMRSLSNAVPPSGDYGYNLSRFIPNSIANIVSYVLAIMFGPRALEFMTEARVFMRANYELAIVGSFVTIFFIASVLWMIQKKIFQEKLILVLGISFVLSLLMYIGLGGATERYALYASGFFIVLVGIVLNRLWVSHATIVGKSIIISLLVVVSLWNFHELTRLEKEWQFASTITEKTLQTMRKNYFPLREHKTFVYVNTPIRYGRAWIFPTGLSDALWHMYRESPFDTVHVSSIEDGFAHPHKKDSAKIVFEFDESFNLQQVVKE
ncbi:MAG: O-antigen ligase family protein [Patescibacteria group bacterium]|nr:O-antigen ligase family protein [Patescibacteria group bacterium]